MSDPGSRRAIRITAAAPDDVSVILGFIRELAEYERLAHEVVADEAGLREHLFGPGAVAEVLLAAFEDEPSAPVGFALHFASFSTFLGRPGTYLEDLYVQPEHRGAGVGGALLRHLAALTVARGRGRLEWSVLDWNEPAIAVYRAIGAVPMDEWTVNRLTGDALVALAARAAERDST